MKKLKQLPSISKDKLHTILRIVGTGLVHTSPGHGQEDYLNGLKNNLEPFAPVDDLGKFTEEAGIFQGLDVLDEGSKKVISELEAAQTLIRVLNYTHKYPYDWRTKKPTIYRATE